MATEEKAPEEEAVPAGAEAAGPSDAEAPEEDAPLAPIIVKKIADGHGGAHGGAWKIALADMMTAMMAFFLLMWILGATNDSQRKSVADYFKPTSQSVVAMGQLAGSNGIMGGRSIIDPDGFPYTAKQTAALQMVTPRSEGGPTENDPSPNSENDRDKERDGMNDSEKKKIVEQADKENFDKLEKEVREQLEQNPNLQKCKGRSSSCVRRKVCVSRSSTRPISPCSPWALRKCKAEPGTDYRGRQIAGRHEQQNCRARPHRQPGLCQARCAQQLVALR